MTGWPEMFRVFGRIGLLSFGGPAAQIALMHRELVETHGWLDEETYLRALSLCMLLPGPEAMQLATYAGWRLRGVPGGLVAGALFVLPGALVILALAAAYLTWGDLPLVQAAFLGLKATVIAIVFQALLRIAQKALNSWMTLALALGALFALGGVGTPFPIVIALAAFVGWFALPRKVAQHANYVTPGRPLQTLLIWGSLWAAPLVLLWITTQEFLLQLGLFFSRLAIVTFGGAYAVLAYMTQEIVQHFGWITTRQMIDALGLAETTPGPLILVTEFVALLAGFAQGGWGLALLAGALCLWVTFVPCFLWILLAGPYVERLAGWPRLSAALTGITAAVVGVIANLSIWFAIHVLFTEVGQLGALPKPVLASFDGQAAILLAGAVACLFLLRLSLPMTLSIIATTSVILTLA